MAGSVRYTWNGEVALAYELSGQGPVDLLFLPGAPNNLDLFRESPRYDALLRGLAAGRRLILTDRRGTGLSDRFSPFDVPPVEALTDDLLHVLDAAGSEQAIVMAWPEPGMVAQFFAAAHPDRGAGLVLFDPVALWVRSRDTPWMPTLEDWAVIMADDRARWGRESRLPFVDEQEREWWLRMQRGTSAPGALVAEMERWTRTDMRPVLPAIR